jgi:hypothetical protein
LLSSILDNFSAAELADASWRTLNLTRLRLWWALQRAGIPCLSHTLQQRISQQFPGDRQFADLVLAGPTSAHANHRVDAIGRENRGRIGLGLIFSVILGSFLGRAGSATQDTSH